MKARNEKECLLVAHLLAGMDVYNIHPGWINLMLWAEIQMNEMDLEIIEQIENES